jgi:imidazolonepropionase-like amidohydrolase
VSAGVVAAIRSTGWGTSAHAHGDHGIRAAIEAGINCIEHGSLMSDETLDLMIERGTFLVPTTYLADGLDVSHAAPELQAKAAEVFPRAKETIRKAVERGARIACGTDAPAIPHGRNAKELLALVDRGMTPMQAIRAATTVAADLIDVYDRGRLEAGRLADVIAVPGDPLANIGVTEDVRFVMKGGQVYRHDAGAGWLAGAPPGGSVPRSAGGVKAKPCGRPTASLDPASGPWVWAVRKRRWGVASGAALCPGWSRYFVI